MAKPWRADRSWSGRVAVVVAGGPSVDVKQIRLLGIARSRDLIRAIAINDAVYLCWWADIAYACDRRWWAWHGSLPRFVGQRLTLFANDDGVIDFDQVGFLTKGKLEPFDPDPAALTTGSNSGYQAVHLAAHLGASRIVLVGFDMHGDHWFGHHPALVRGSDSPFETFKKKFAGLAHALSGMGVEVVNATPGSALTCFPCVDLTTEISSLEEANG